MRRKANDRQIETVAVESHERAAGRQQIRESRVRDVVAHELHQPALLRIHANDRDRAGPRRFDVEIDGHAASVRDDGARRQ